MTLVLVVQVKKWESQKEQPQSEVTSRESLQNTGSNEPIKALRVPCPQKGHPSVRMTFSAYTTTDSQAFIQGLLGRQLKKKT